MHSKIWHLAGRAKPRIHDIHHRNANKPNQSASFQRRRFKKNKPCTFLLCASHCYEILVVELVQLFKHWNQSRLIERILWKSSSINFLRQSKVYSMYRHGVLFQLVSASFRFVSSILTFNSFYLVHTLMRWLISSDRWSAETVLVSTLHFLLLHSSSLPGVEPL